MTLSKCHLSREFYVIVNYIKVDQGIFYFAFQFTGFPRWERLVISCSVWAALYLYALLLEKGTSNIMRI